MKISRLVAPAVAILLAVPLAACPAHADVITYFNFNDGNLVSDIPTGGPTPVQTTTITKVGTSGTLTSPTTGGTTLNALGTDAAGGSLQVTNASVTGITYQFTANLSNYKNAVLSYSSVNNQAAVPTGSTTVSYSIDGTNFTTIGTDSITNSYAKDSFDLSSFTNLNGASSATFRFSGYNDINVTYNIDNIQLNATAAATPEPSTWAMMALGVGVMATMFQRRKRSES